MVARNGVRGTAGACLGLVALLMATGAACSPEPLPEKVDLSGEWLLSDSVTGLSEGGSMPRVCKTWNRPMHLWVFGGYLGDSTYGAVEAFGGTVSCASEGVFNEPTPLQGHPPMFFLTLYGDSIVLFNQELFIRYRATTVSPDRLAGEVYLPILGRPDDHAVHGTWELVRAR